MSTVSRSQNVLVEEETQTSSSPFIAVSRSGEMRPHGQRQDPSGRSRGGHSWGNTRAACKVRSHATAAVPTPAALLPDSPRTDTEVCSLRRVSLFWREVRGGCGA